jgi:pyrimidine-specific ribonucleoside hydrolase
MTVGDLRTKTDRQPNVNVLLDVDRDAFIRLLFDALAILDARYVQQASQGES